MKKIILLFAVLFICLPAMLFSQTFYGLTPSGGLSGGGALIKYESATNTLSSVFSFPNDPKKPATYGTPVQASNGKLYGMTSDGGIGYGTVFSFDPVTNTEVQLVNFDHTNGALPTGSLIQATNGKLYGMTFNGGINNNQGTIFSFDPANNSLIKLADFAGANGANPYGSLVQASNGKLYGMTLQGGSNGSGTAFSFDPSTNELVHLLDFVGTNGANPFGNLIQATDGKLYGMTLSGGSDGSGIIFSLDPVTNIQTHLYDFLNSNNGFPYGSLVQASNGKLYGMTGSGSAANNFSGTIFSFDLSTNTQTELFDFTGDNGAQPYGNFLQAANGKLYAMTSRGGSSSLGTIFSFDPATNAQVKLADFIGINGETPYGGFVQATNGKLYGTTYSGGIGGSGTIFSFDPVTTTQVSLYSFNTTNTNSTSPSGSLVKAGNRKLYGMSSNGGTVNQGTIFSFDPTTNKEVKLVDFTGINGTEPFGSALVDPGNGKLYGTTGFGGSSNNGTLFSFDPLTNIQTKLIDFTGTNGAIPSSSLVNAGNGKLYGTTQGGGSFGSGTIFSFDPLTSIQTLVFTFTSTSGLFPSGGLIKASNGLLYGMTPSSGDNTGSGSIFSFEVSTNTYTQLFEFNGTNGANPYGSLMQASNGKMYGTTLLGGTAYEGTFFSFDPLTNTLVKLIDFTGSNGTYPNGSLVEGDSGKLFGMTAGGGSIDLGVLFSYDINANVFTQLQDFNGQNGASPFWGAVLLPVATGIPPVVNIIAPTPPATFDAGTTVTIKAKATDSDGSIAKTELFINGVFYKKDSVSPYVFNIPNMEPGLYKVTVKATDNTGLSASSDTTVVKIIACNGSGKVTLEEFTNIKGSQITDLTSNRAYPNSPKITTTLTSYEYTNRGDNYGARTRGYICAPVTGKYIFNISGDEQAVLYLSTDKNPEHKALIAYTLSPTKFREWNKFSTQKSLPVQLVKGATYYIETLHKEATGADHISVAWTIPGGAFEGPIPGTRLSPFFLSGFSNGRVADPELDNKNGVSDLQVMVMPNPSNSYFTIKIASNTNKPVSVKIMDGTSRVVEYIPAATPNSTLQIGGKLMAGIYFVEVKQDGKKQQLKLVKE